MMPSQLNPAQLMMGFLANEQGKLGKKIAKSEFSKELEAQSSRAEGAGGLGSPRSEENPARGGNVFPLQNDHKLQSANTNTKASQKLSPQKRSVEAKQEKVRDNLVFTDVATVEKVAAQFHLSADARKELKSAEDSEGRVSLKTLEAILSHQDPSAQNTLPGQDQASAQDVQKLFSSIQQANPDPSNPLPQLSAKPGGFYTLDEFKSALDGMVQQIAAKEATSNQQVLHDSTKLAGLSNAKTQTGPASVKSAPAEQVQRLTNNLMPSFGKNGSDGGKAGKLAGSMSSGAAGDQVQAQVQAQSQTLKEAGTASLSADVSKATQPGNQNGSMPSSGNEGKSANIPGSAGAAEKTAQQQIASLGDSDFQDQSGQKSSSPDQAGSDRMAQLGSMDSSLVAGAEEEAGAARSTPGTSASDNQLRFIQVDPGSRSDAARIAAFASSGDTSSQGERQMKDQGAFGGFHSDAIGGQQLSGTLLGADSFQTVSAAVQTTQSGQGSSSPTLSLTDPAWPAQLAQRIQDLQQDKRNQITLELEPKNMGKMTLRIQTEHNQVTAWVSTENEHVKSLLAQNASVLKQQLQDQGLMLGQFHVDVRQEKDSQYSARQNGSSRKQTRTVSATSQAGGATDEAGSVSNRMVYRQEPGQQLISCFA